MVVGTSERLEATRGAADHDRPMTHQAAAQRRSETRDRRASQPAHQMPLPNKPNCGCRATRTIDGGARFFAILRWRSSFGVFGSDSCSCPASDGCICANASRTCASVEASATIAGARMLASVFAIDRREARVVWKRLSDEDFLTNKRRGGEIERHRNLAKADFWPNPPLQYCVEPMRSSVVVFV